MNADEPRNLSKDLLQARNRFQTWRSQRPIGRPIPESLWNLAVKLVRQHGLSLTARVLQLDYYGLKKRTQEGHSQVPSRQPGFIQLPSPLPTGKQAVFELEPGTGTKLRVQLLGYDTADLETLVRHFGNKG